MGMYSYRPEPEITPLRPLEQTEYSCDVLVVGKVLQA